MRRSPRLLSDRFNGCHFELPSEQARKLRDRDLIVTVWCAPAVFTKSLETSARSSTCANRFPRRSRDLLRSSRQSLSLSLPLFVKQGDSLSCLEDGKFWNKSSQANRRRFAEKVSLTSFLPVSGSGRAQNLVHFDSGNTGESPSNQENPDRGFYVGFTGRGILDKIGFE